MKKTLAERCREARIDAGLEPTEAARKLGIKQPSLHAIESGRTRALRSTTSVAMTQVYGVSADWLVNERGPKRIPQDADNVVAIPLRNSMLGDARRARFGRILSALESAPDEIPEFWADIDSRLDWWERRNKLRHRAAGPGATLPRRAPGKRGGGGT